MHVSRGRGRKKSILTHQLAEVCLPDFWSPCKSAERRSQRGSTVTFISCVPNKWSAFISARRAECSIKPQNKQANKNCERGSLTPTGFSLYPIKDGSHKPKSYQEIEVFTKHLPDAGILLILYMILLLTLQGSTAAPNQKYTWGSSATLKALSIFPSSIDDVAIYLHLQYSVKSVMLLTSLIRESPEIHSEHLCFPQN